MVNTKKLAALLFRGGRFETNALSFDALPDLLVYRDLLIDLARHLWLQEHEGRRRAPRRFDASFPMYLRGVEAGSAKAILECEDADPELAPYLDRACAMVNDLVTVAGDGDAATASFPAKLPLFPAALARHFHRFGRKLRPDEWVELQVKEGEGPRYDPSIGKRITLAYTGHYEDEVVVEGELGGIDVHRAKVSIKTCEGDILDVPGCAPELLETAVALFRRPVQLTVVAEFNRNGVRERVKEGRAMRPLHDEESVEGASLLVQFDRLRDLAPGWFEPNTPALDRQGLIWLQAFLTRVTEQSACRRPFLYPTEEGEARAEWTLGTWEVALTADLSTARVDAHATDVRSDETRQLQLSLIADGDAARFVQWLSQFPAAAR